MNPLFFSSLFRRYLYSRVPKDGFNNPVIRAAASYLVDGVLDVNAISAGLGIESLLSTAGLDWITKGTCHAGDIRVHFEGRALPEALSVVGKQIGGGHRGAGIHSGSRVVPMTYVKTR